jgi:ketosteroid isomerase-like protein
MSEVVTERSKVARAEAERPSEEEVRGVVSSFDESYDARDVDGVVALFAEDGDWTVGPGTFSGRASVRRLMEWDVGLSPTLRSRQTGVGIVAKGDVAASERVIEQTIEGVPIEYPVLSVFEMNGAGEIQHLRSYYDKLGLMRDIAKEYPGIKGWFFRTLINFVVAQGEKGLARG